MTLLRRATHLVAALALTGAATIGAASQPAQATTTPTHVAIVVAGVGSACVPWHSGMTGADVLSANFTVTYGQPPSYAGFVLMINGIGTDRPDNTHYWAYFHDTGGGWVYSGSGAASFDPQPGTVEGWAYDNGQNPAPSPASSSYAAICAGQDPAPAPTHPPSTHHTSSASAAQPGQPAPPDPASGAAGTGSAAVTSSGAGTAASPTQLHATARTASAAKAAPSSDTSAPVVSAPAVALVGAAPKASHTSAAPAWGTGLALVAAAAIGGIAFWRLRRPKQN